MKKKEELMKLIKEADEITAEKMKKKENFEKLQKKVEEQQQNFKEEYSKLVKKFQKKNAPDASRMDQCALDLEDLEILKYFYF